MFVCVFVCLCVCVFVCVCVWLLFSSYKTCFASLPSGNQVDGLPLVVNTDEGVIWPSVGWYVLVGRDPLIVFNLLCLCQI